MRYFLTSIVFVFAIQGYSQKNLKCQAVSVFDSTPLATIHFIIKYKTHVTTDSSGCFSVSVPQLKKAVQIDSYCQIRGIDTIASSKSLLQLRIYLSKTVDSLLAKYDMEHNKMLFYCAIGYAPLAPLNSDLVFEKAYGVRYDYLGCIVPAEPEQLAEYNKTVAAYLDKKFGKDWRRQVRPDVCGITQ